MITNDYGNGIKHNRTQPLSMITPEQHKTINEQRKKYYEKII